MTPAERALLRDCATALDVVWALDIGRRNTRYIAALQQRIREALEKKGKRK